MYQFLAMLPEMLSAAGSLANAGTAAGATEAGAGNLMNYGAAMQQGAPRDPNNLMTYGVPGSTGEPAPEEPKPPTQAFDYGDPSGFANAGMQAPPLQDPMSQLGMLMGMVQKPKEKIPVPQGNLMSYLQQLGAL